MMKGKIWVNPVTWMHKARMITSYGIKEYAVLKPQSTGLDQGGKRAGNG